MDDGSGERRPDDTPAGDPAAGDAAPDSATVPQSDAAPEPATVTAQPADAPARPVDVPEPPADASTAPADAPTPVAEVPGAPADPAARADTPAAGSTGPADPPDRVGLVSAVRRRLPSRGLLVWYSCAGVVIIVLGTILAWPQRPGVIERTVRDFLGAIEQHDAGRARDLVDGETLPDFAADNEDTSFLRGAAFGQAWHVDAIRALDEPDEYINDIAVDVRLSAAGGNHASYQFHVVRQDEGEPWRIADPYVYVGFSAFPVDYVDIDGRRKKLPQDRSEAPTYVLFPGVHRFFGSAPEAVRHSTEGHALLPGRYFVRQGDDRSPSADRIITVPEMTMTAPAQRDAQRAVDAYLDECVERDELLSAGCPFGAESVPEPGKPDRAFYGNEVTSAKWEVQRYPVVTVQPYGGEYRVVDRRPGVMKLTVTGKDKDTGFTATTSMTCPTRDHMLRIEVSASGALRVYPRGARYDAKDVDSDPVYWQSC